MTKTPDLFDKPLLASRLIARSNETVDFVTELVIADLADRLGAITRTFSNPLIMAPDAARLPQALNSAEAPIEFRRASTLVPDEQFASFDPESFQPGETDFDLIISLFDIGITNDVPGFLTQIIRHLAPDGLFVAAFIGGNSLAELRAAWLEADAVHTGGALARVAPFIDTKDAGNLLQRAGFALPVADAETHTIRYPSPLALMRELKACAASNPMSGRSGKLVTPSHLASASMAYEKAAKDKDGRIRATLDIIWISGWAPHESQQQPMAPGSAQISLTKVLGSK